MRTPAKWFATETQAAGTGPAGSLLLQARHTFAASKAHFRRKQGTLLPHQGQHKVCRCINRQLLPRQAGQRRQALLQLGHTGADRGGVGFQQRHATLLQAIHADAAWHAGEADATELGGLVARCSVLPLCVDGRGRVVRRPSCCSVAGMTTRPARVAAQCHASGVPLPAACHPPDAG